jgi:hypothetical protein
MGHPADKQIKSGLERLAIRHRVDEEVPLVREVLILNTCGSNVAFHSRRRWSRHANCMVKRDLSVRQIPSAKGSSRHIPIHCRCPVGVMLGRSDEDELSLPPGSLHFWIGTSRCFVDRFCNMLPCPSDRQPSSRAPSIRGRDSGFESWFWNPHRFIDHRFSRYARRIVCSHPNAGCTAPYRTEELAHFRRPSSL